MKDLKEDYMYKLQTQSIIHNITLKQNTEHKQALQDKDEKQDILNLKNYIDELEAKNKELQTNLDQYFYHSAPETKFEYYNEVKQKTDDKTKLKYNYDNNDTTEKYYKKDILDENIKELVKPKTEDKTKQNITKLEYNYINEMKPKIKFEYYINEVKTADQLDAEVTKATTENVFKFIDEVFDSEEEEKEKAYQEAMSTVLMAMKAENDKMKKLKQQKKKTKSSNQQPEKLQNLYKILEENPNHNQNNQPPNKKKNKYKNNTKK